MRLEVDVAPRITERNRLSQSIRTSEEPEQAADTAVRTYQPGSEADFDRLYRQTYSRVLLMLRGMLRDLSAAEDCAQEAFLKAFRSWNKCQTDGSAEAWINRIAINTAHSYRRYEKLRQIGEVIRRIGPPQSGNDPSNRDGTIVLEGLRRLRPKDSAIIVLRHHHGFSNREIAQALGIPESTIASRLASAKAKLGAELINLGLDERLVTLSHLGVKDLVEHSGRDAHCDN